MIVEHCIYPMASCVTRWNNTIDKDTLYFGYLNGKKRNIKRLVELTRKFIWLY